MYSCQRNSRIVNLIKNSIVNRDTKMVDNLKTYAYNSPWKNTSMDYFVVKDRQTTDVLAQAGT